MGNNDGFGEPPVREKKQIERVVEEISSNWRPITESDEVEVDNIPFF
jgi:hypothetical protein